MSEPFLFMIGAEYRQNVIAWHYYMGMQDGFDCRSRLNIGCPNSDARRSYNAGYNDALFWIYFDI